MPCQPSVPISQILWETYCKYRNKKVLRFKLRIENRNRYLGKEKGFYVCTQV